MQIIISEEEEQKLNDMCDNTECPVTKGCRGCIIGFLINNATVSKGVEIEKITI